MKSCNTCGEIKDEEEFAFRNKAAGIRRSNCRACVSKSDQKNYLTSAYRRDKIKERKREQRVLNLIYVREYLRSHPCVDCGESDIRCLDFDHLGDKVENVTRLAGNGVSVVCLEAEIAKCEVRCANCHRKVTYDRAGWTYAS